MSKYTFLILLSLAAVLLINGNHNSREDQNRTNFHSVSGSIAVEKMGFALSHEHIMSNFGKDISETSEYDEAALVEQVVPYLRRIKSLGVDTIFDCTTAHFGRRVDLLQTIADSTGLHIVTNTGYYGAADDRYVPKTAYNSTPGEISEHWVDEFENGIDGTNVKPGFIKLAFDDGTPSEIDKKLFEAGIMTHLETGLTLAVHTGNNPEAVDIQLNLLQQFDVSPEAWIWTHAHTNNDLDLLIETAQKGAWISLDRVNSSNIQSTVDWLQRFKSEDLLHKILLSHDGNGFPGGGELRPFEAVMKELIPALKKNNFTDEEIDQLFAENPKKAFSIKIRKL
jgi:phosphotriesterase-related protein